MKTASKKAAEEHAREDVKWYAIRAFKADDKDEVGFLAIDKGANGTPYVFVEDLCDAMKLPSKNINQVSGFGTPAQWLEFFKGEDELSSWKIHLVKVAAPEKS